MKTIIAGSRTIVDYELVKQAIQQSQFEITEVISGNAPGPDRLGIRWATENKIPYKIFHANWNSFGRAAGILRNKQMGDYSDALIAIWDGTSRGTKHMIEYATQNGLNVFVYRSNI